MPVSYLLPVFLVVHDASGRELSGDDEYAGVFFLILYVDKVSETFYHWYTIEMQPRLLREALE